MDFLINNSHGNFYYDLFYRLSFVLLFLVFLFEGWRRKYSITSLLLIGAVTAFFAILGSKLSAYQMSDWQLFFETGSLPLPSGKSSFGAIVLGWLGIGIGQRLAGFRHSALDLYALAIPVALISQRLGCLLVGCCFGNPSTLPWAIYYGEGHVAWEAHHTQGLIQGMQGETSLGVHPTQGYFILSYLLIILIISKLRHKFKANGNLALFGLALVFTFRFFIEFFRDPLTNHGWGMSILGIKQIQWLLLLVATVFLAIIRYREYKYRSASPTNEVDYRVSLLRKLALFSIPVAGITLLPTWFEFSEITVIYSHLVFAGLALSWTVFHKITHPQFRGITLAILVTAIFTLGQTYRGISTDTLVQKQKLLHSFSFGFLEGTNPYDYTVTTHTPAHTDGCGTRIPAKTTIDNYNIGPYLLSAGINYQVLREVRRDEYNGWLFGANLTTYNLRQNYISTHEISDITMSIHRRWLRPFYSFDLGLHTGTPLHIGGWRNTIAVFPSARLRVGPQDKAFFDFGFASDHPYGITTSHWNVGGGIGLPLFGIDYDGGILFGLNNIGPRKAYYLTPRIPIGRFELYPTFRFAMDDDIYNLGLRMKWKVNGRNTLH